MTTTITNVRIFDGRELHSADAVRFAEGTIVAIGGPDILEPQDRHVDGHGGTLLPGLIDAHVHLLPGAPAQSVGFGVTTVLDMFSKPPLVGECLRDGRLAGHANVRSSSVGATAPGGHPSMMYAPFPYVHGPADAPEFVASRIDEGASYLKVLYEGGQAIDWSMPSIDLPTVRALVDAAHDAGLPVIAHIHRAEDAVDVVECGVDVLAHAPIDRLVPQQIRILV